MRSCTTSGSSWARRRVALGSLDYTGAEIAELDELIEAHFEGLAAAGEDAIPLLVAQVHGDDPLHAFAGASALLRVGTPEALDEVREAFATAKGKKLDALRDAIAHGPSAPLKAPLMSLVHSEPLDVGAAAAEALAFLGGFGPTPEQIERFVRAKEAAVQRDCSGRIQDDRRGSRPDRRAGKAVDRNQQDGRQDFH